MPDAGYGHPPTSAGSPSVIDVTNDTDSDIDVARFKDLGRFVLGEMRVSEEADVTILFVDEAEMESLHLKWMDESGPTDVLAFPMDELRPGMEGEPLPTGILGDVVVCPSIAARQAEEAAHSVENEMYLLVVHGMLHLLGYDHFTPDQEREMFGLQGSLLTGFVTGQV